MKYGFLVAALWVGVSSAYAAEPSKVATQQQKIPAAALALVEDSPLLKRALTEPDFFPRLDQDATFQESLRNDLASTSYRKFGSTPSVRVEMWRGTSTEQPMILLDHQTSFKQFAKLPPEGAVIKSPVFAGVGRDAMWHRTFYGGTEDPAAREEFEQLMKDRAAMRSNQRATMDPKFTEIAEKYLPTTPLPQVREDLKSRIERLVDACKPLGAKVLSDSQYGAFGAKITDNLYLYLRDFPNGAPGRSAADPFLWLVVSGGPKVWTNDYLPSFPGAEGMGARTTGGRSGRVIYVTTLEPNGEGSLGEALRAKGPRIVLFKVSGQIVVPDGGADAVNITEPNLTLIGYTAPGEGIEIKGPLNISADNVIMRGMRFRMKPPFIKDGMNTTGNLRNIIFDHCSFAYASDEQLRMIGNGTQFLGFTIQYCLLGPGLAGIGDHPYGPEMGGYGSVHHNIFYNTLSRSPEIDCDLIDWRNNLMANLRRGHSDRPRSRMNFVSNYIVNIPGNFADSYDFGTTDAVFLANNTIDNSGVRKEFGSNTSSYLRAPYLTAPVTTDKPEDLEAKLVPIAGAFLPARDSTDRYFMARFQEKKSKLPYFQKPGTVWKPYGNENDNPQLYELWDEANFPPPAAGAAAELDSDNDGMPDAWEIKHKLNPKDAADGPQDADRDGYTNVEEYLNRTAPKRYVDYKQAKNNVHSLHPKF